MATPSQEETDYAISPIPLNERKGPITMGLLWLTMVTSFPAVMIGFEWYRRGLTLSQVATCTGLSCVVLLLYAIPATQLGARTGLSYTALSRNVFGTIGSRLITFNLIWLFTAVYGLFALYFADALIGLFHLKIPLVALSAIIAVLMSINNFFGFKGVANFARYIAAPAMMIWIGYTFIKAASLLPPSVLHQAPTVAFPTAITTVSTFVIGLAVWGNECDYWRHSKAGVRSTAVPLFIALLIGQVVFPTAGWMAAKVSGITDYTAATAFMNSFSFGGIAAAAAFVLGAAYFACNDSNLFGAVQACENLKQLTHRNWSAIIALLGALCAVLLSAFGAVKSTEVLASLNCVIMPIPTVIVLAEWLLGATLFGVGRVTSSTVPSYAQLPMWRGPAMFSLLAGTLFGIVTSGVFPGTEKFNIGIFSAQAWIFAFILYIPLRIAEQDKLKKQQRKLERLLEPAGRTE
jgi:purine-cytosine permease-like protein